MSDREFERLRELFEQTIRFNRYLGLRVRDLQVGMAETVLPYREEFLGDPFRPALHGGVISFLVDVTGGLAVFTRLTPDDRCSTVDLRVDYFEPARQQDLVARAQVVRLGNRVGVSNVSVFHTGSTAVIAEGKGVYNLRKSRPLGKPCGR